MRGRFLSFLGSAPELDCYDKDACHWSITVCNLDVHCFRFMFFKIALKAQDPFYPLVEHLCDRCWGWWRWPRTPCVLLTHGRHMQKVTGWLGQSLQGGLQVSSSSVEGVRLLQCHMTPTCKNSFLHTPIRASLFRADSSICPSCMLLGKLLRLFRCPFLVFIKNNNIHLPTSSV